MTPRENIEGDFQRDWFLFIEVAFHLETHLPIKKSRNPPRNLPIKSSQPSRIHIAKVGFMHQRTKRESPPQRPFVTQSDPQETSYPPESKVTDKFRHNQFPLPTKNRNPTYHNPSVRTAEGRTQTFLIYFTRSNAG
jgi:hypothetical protein